MQWLWPNRRRITLLRLFRWHGVEIELADTDLGSFSENHRLHDAVLELADIPGPMLFLHQKPCGGGETQRTLLILECEMIQKVLSEKDDVITALAQWRDVNPNDVQAMVEVFSESSRRRFDGELTIRDRHESRVDA